MRITFCCAMIDTATPLFREIKIALLTKMTLPTA